MERDRLYIIRELELGDIIDRFVVGLLKRVVQK